MCRDGQAGAVDQAVDPPERLLRLGVGRLDLVHVGNIAGDEEGLCALSRQLGDELLAHVCPATGHDDSSAPSHGGASDRGTNSLSTSADKDDLVPEQALCGRGSGPSGFRRGHPELQTSSVRRRTEEAAGCG